MMGSENRPFIRIGLANVWRAFVPYALAGSLLVAAYRLWNGDGLRTAAVTSVFIFIVLMLPGIVGAGVGIVAVLLSRLKL